MESLENLYVKDLSGGELQRVAIVICIGTPWSALACAQAHLHNRKKLVYDRDLKPDTRANLWSFCDEFSTILIDFCIHGVSKAISGTMKKNAI